MVELLWYQGLTQAETAEVLNVTDRTVRRRWVPRRRNCTRLFAENLPRTRGNNAQVD